MGWRRPCSSKALKAQALVDEVEPVRPGKFVLVQAAGGGVGQLVAKMARRKGGIVILHGSVFGEGGDCTRSRVPRSDPVPGLRCRLACHGFDERGRCQRCVRCGWRGEDLGLFGIAFHEGTPCPLWSGIRAYSGI